MLQEENNGQNELSLLIAQWGTECWLTWGCKLVSFI